MAIENNPIFQLCKEVLHGRSSPEQASEKVASVGFQKGINESHCMEMVEAIPDEYSSEAITSSYFTLLCAEFIKVEECLWAKANLIHGKILRQGGGYHNALKHLNAAKIIFDKKDMRVDVADCDINIAASYENLSQYGKALKLYQSAQKIFDEKGMQEDVAGCNMYLAGVYQALGQHDKAIELLQSARGIFDRKGVQTDIAECNMQLANVYQTLGQYDKALELYQSAQKIFDEKRMQEDVAGCNMYLAGVYRALGQHDKSLKVLQSARDIFDRKGVQTDIAACNMRLANLYQTLGQYDKAIELYQSARKICDERGMQASVAQCDMNIASVYLSLGQYDKAIELHQSAQKIFAESGMQADVARCDMNIANVYWYLGQYDKALELYQSAQKICNESGMQADVAQCDMNIASVYLSLGQYDKAIELHQSAQKIFAEKDMTTFVAHCDMNIALVYQALGQYDKAVELLQSAQEIFDESGMQADVAHCDRNIGVLYLSLGQYDKAIELHQSAQKIFAEKDMTTFVAHCDMNIALVYQALGQYDKAIELHQSAQKIFAEKDMTAFVARCNLTMAFVYENLLQYDKALELCGKVNETHGDMLDFKWRTLYLMGRIFSRQGILEKARTFYGAAIDVIENMRGSISRAELRTSFLTTVYHVYYEMVDLCIAQKDFKAALEYVEQLKSRNLAEFLADHDLMPKNASEEDRREYQDLRFKMRAYAYRLSKEQDDGTRAGVSKEDLDKLEEKHEEMVQHFRKRNASFDPDQKVRISYPEIRDLVRDGESVLVELFPMEDKTVAFIVLRDGSIEESTVVIPDYNTSNLINHINGLQERYKAYQKSDHLKKEDCRKRWEDYLDDILAELYEKLFLRIKPYVEGVGRIIMSPYWAFHLLPLHAMFAEEDGHRRYVIDDYMVTYAPSAKVLKYCKDRERDKRERLVVALANPKATNMLQFAQNEAEAISELFDGSRLISRATKEDIINYGREAHIFHYTGHANHKTLMLHSENDEEIKEEYHLEDLFVSLDLPDAYLATLSACETGVTELGKLDEYIGLTSGFLHAGAATVISSLWSVSDISTTLLMKKMYELIKEGKGKAAALREAQLWLKNPDNSQEHRAMLPEWCKETKTEQISTDQNRFDLEAVDSVLPLPDDMSHPYYWAGFICSGVE